MDFNPSVGFNGGRFGEEHERGTPGLLQGELEFRVSPRGHEESETGESKRLVLKFGMPQLKHCHGRLELARAKYTLVFIPMHSA